MSASTLTLSHQSDKTKDSAMNAYALFKAI